MFFDIRKYIKSFKIELLNVESKTGPYIRRKIPLSFLKIENVVHVIYYF